jgi:hypothetical protein
MNAQRFELLRPALAVSVLSAALWVSPARAQGLSDFIFKRSPGSKDTVTVFADGNLRSAVGQGEDATLASGDLGLRVRKETVLLSLRIAATGTGQALRERQAAAILVPGTGSSLNAGYGEIRITTSKEGAFVQSGLRGYVSVTTAQWTDTLTDRTVGALVGGAGVGGFVNLFGGTLGGTPPANPGEAQGAGKTRVAAVLDLGLAWRTLGGDIADVTNEDVLIDLFDSAAKNRLGLEAGLALQLNDLKAGLTYYLFGGSVPGLSRGQVVAGFSVAVPLISGALD